MNKDLSLPDQLVEHYLTIAGTSLDARNVARKLRDKDLAYAFNETAAYFMATAEIIERRAYKPPTPESEQA